MQQFGKICRFTCLHNALLFKWCNNSRLECLKLYTGITWHWKINL